MSAIETLPLPEVGEPRSPSTKTPTTDRASDAKPMKSASSPLSPAMSTEEAIAALLRNASTMIERNALVMMLSENPEGPHQYRVGLRRMRSVLKTARPVTARAAVRPIEAWARDLGSAASIWRDADVIVDDIVTPALAAGAAPSGGAALRDALNAARNTSRDRARRELRRIGAVGFLAALAAFVDEKGWRVAPTDRATEKAAKAQAKRLDAPARRHAVRALNRAWRDSASWGVRLAELSIDERHEMRKALKTLRYTVDAYAPLFDDAPEKTAAFAKELRRLQNVFGYLNDVAMAEALVERVSQSKRPATAAILAWHADRAAKAWEKAQRRWRAMVETPRFW